MQDILTMSSFEIEVATLDAWGKTIQCNRNKANYFQEIISPSVQLNMVQIPSGEFRMGSPENELERVVDEGPQQTMTLPPFFMGQYPITQSQWKAIALLPQINHPLNPEPSKFKGPNRPVEGVTWHDAIEFCSRLSHYTARDYRLPSEAEWEYACRAGTVGPFHFGEAITTDYANYCGEHQNINETSHKGNYGSASTGVNRQSTTEVGYFQIANSFGLYDMHGNIWEWCSGDGSDTYLIDSPDYWLVLDSLENGQKPLRGGAWNSPPKGCRSACRFFMEAHARYAWCGFRIVCDSVTPNHALHSAPLISKIDSNLENSSVLTINNYGGDLNLMTDKAPIFHQQHATIGVNYATEGSKQEFTQNINATEKNFEILLADYEQFINELQQKYPNTTDKAAIAKVIDLEYQEMKRLQPQRWKKILSFKRLLNGGRKAVVKGGEHLTEHNFWGKIGVALLEGLMEDSS
jgi:formylglycine-generating enzyme required for sulfatase activity